MKRYILALFAITLLFVSCGEKEQEIVVTSVSVSPSNAELTIGGTVQLTATLQPSNATEKIIIWSSSNQSVATVSNNGMVTALAEGTSTVTASCGGKSGTCQVIVRKPTVEVTSISLNKEELALIKGQSEILVATVNPSDATDKTVSWDSSDKDVASVDANGKVTAVAGGTATITAKAGNYQTTCKVTVIVPVESISLNHDDVSLEEEQSVSLVATVMPDNATDKTVTWSSSDAQVATVDESGMVTAIKEGSAIITAKAGDKTANCSIFVIKKYIAVTSVTLNKTELTLIKSQSETLTATVKPDGATDKKVTWSSSNSGIATVDQNGMVTAIAGGSATITAKAGHKQAICTVSVKEASPEAVDLGLSVKWASFNVGASKPEDYGDYYAWGETETKEDYSWETYKWCNGSSNTLTKYNIQSDYGTVDNKTILDPEDDVATTKLGGKWRMPTDEEWTELRDKCTWTWTTQNGVDGRLVTGLNSNTIFLPAAGFRDGAILFYSGGGFGLYWSSSLNTRHPINAMCVNFVSVYVDRVNFFRYSGQSVRPVLAE